MQTIEHFALGLVRGQVADQRRFCRIATQLVDSRPIVFHVTRSVVAGPESEAIRSCALRSRLVERVGGADPALYREECRELPFAGVSLRRPGDLRGIQFG